MMTRSNTQKTGLMQGASWFLGWILLGLLVAQATYAEADQRQATQNLAALKPAIHDFLAAQSTAYPGRVEVLVGAIDPRLKLAQCDALSVFLPPGSRAWGKTTVGVRCNAPSAWTVYAQASVNVKASYLVTAKPLSQGHVMEAQDVFMQEGDLTQLPAGIFTDMAQVVGRSVSTSLAAGSVLRQDFLKQALSVQQGQTVALVSEGQGFTVTSEGRALKNAVEGQVVQVKVQNGQTVSGIATADGKVAISF